MRDKTRDMRVIKKGDYVPNGLFFPPWGDGTYRVFKLSKVVDTMEDKMEDEIRDFPEGEHDDQVDAIPFPDFKSPMVLRRWFNVLMLIINLGALVLLLLAIPVAVGFAYLGSPVTLLDWVTTWAIGLVGTAGIVIGAIYFVMVFNESLKGIKRNIALIRKNLR